MDDRLYRIRHSSAHILAQAVLEVFPDAKLGIGPPVQDGFYYDFLLSRPLTDEDLEDFESRMRRIIEEDQSFERIPVSKEEALKTFHAQPFKRELIELILSGALDENLDHREGEPEISLYRNGPFVDLCRGPHVESTGAIDPNAVKLLHVSAAYWRGDERRDSLQRVYGTAWYSKEELEGYVARLEEAKKRDHRVLGKKLELYLFSDSVGQGLVLWQPRAGIVRYLAERFSQEAHVLNGYEMVYTPHIGKASLWETSGHLDFYKDSMYSPIEIEGEAYYLKPMSCPFHIQIYRSRPRSYRELPLRLAEFATVYRYERSGTLQGMTRVRGFTQDDAHIFCTPDQVRQEIWCALRFSLYVLREFELTDFVAYLSTRPSQKAIGSSEKWEEAQDVLRSALEREGLAYEIDEGGGAFYGPKIDLKVRDSLGREWQLSTIQFDFNLPERFELMLITSDGGRVRPYMVHRALFGSAERFFAMLTEHFAGAFPLWLAPVQVVMVPITDNQNDYAESVAAQLRAEGLRVEVDSSGNRMNAKIRNAQEFKIPFILVIGKREAQDGTVAVRDRVRGDLGTMGVEAFLDMTREERQKGKAVVLPPLPQNQEVSSEAEAL